MDRPIRVAQVIGMAINGGTESFVMNYYKYIDRNKVQFDFFVESTSKIINKDIIENMGGKVIIIPSYKNVFKYMRTLKKLFKDGNYDIVHSHMNTLSVFTLRAAKKAGIKVRIAHSHTFLVKNNEHIKNFIKNILKFFSKKYATNYFACGEQAGRWLFGNKTYKKGLVSIINNAIDLNKFKFDVQNRNEIKEEYNIVNKIVIGNIGRFQTQKNQLFLLEIFAEIIRRDSNYILLILGDGPLRECLMKKCDDLKISQYVFFVGVKTNPEKFYSAMDCFVLPSLYEGFPIVGVEAQINGLPCFFSDTITSEILLTPNSSKISLDSSVVFWCEKIISVLSNKSLGRTNAYKIFEKSKYDIEYESNNLMKKYFEIIKR